MKWHTILHLTSFTGSFLLLSILYGLSAMPFAYLISFLVKTQASGFTISIIIDILSGNREIAAIMSMYSDNTKFGHVGKKE